MLLKDKLIRRVCENCGKENTIPLRVFYDGFDGPILCQYCNSELDIDTDYE